MLKRLNDALPGLVLGILIYGLLVQLVGMWFVQDKLYYTIGLWYGVAIAVAMAIHLAAVIYDTATLYDENRASKMAVVKSVTRYAVVAVLFFLIAYFHFGNVVMAFVGVLGIKVSAYLVLPVNNLLARIFPNRFTPSVGDDEELLAEYLAQQEAELQTAGASTEESVCDRTDAAEDTACGTADAIENIAGEASTNKTE
ncbi:MAG: hypothetical protein MR016_04050 [Agathobacter sp.]|nr:hypothetical protein [Agathobacter sp.]